MEIWTTGKLDRVAGRASTAAIRIVDRFEAKAIDPPEAPHGDDAKGWGQYVDDEHRTDDQWGFYGTSAGVQALATKQRAFGTDPQSSVRLIEQALKQLPEDPVTTDERFAEKRQKGDFENIIKLAFIADALRPDADEVVDDLPPAVVGAILGRAVDNQFWSSRPADDPARRSNDRLFPTAYVLLVLQRYRSARAHPAYSGARVWLAERVQQDAALDTPANNALIGLALLDRQERPQARPGVISDALQNCEDRLLRWAAHEKALVIDRPVYYGFALGKRNDYSFLHPEVLAALLLLRRGNPPRGRSFVLRVMRSMTDNIIGSGGFVGQNGMMSAVDQMWAMRLIGEFRALHDTDNGHQRLLPVRDQRALLLTSTSRLIAVVAAVVAALGIALLTMVSLEAAVAAWLIAVLMLIANVLAIPVKGN